KLLPSGEDDSGGTSGSGASPFGGSAGTTSGGASGRGGATGGTATGGRGGTPATGGTATGGTSGSDGGAGAGGEGPDPCSPPGTPPDVRVDYKEGGRAVTDDPGGEIRLQNQTAETIPLRELSFRYWFASEFTCAETSDAWTVSIDDFRFQNPHVEKSKPDVTIGITTLGTENSGCSAYFELGFARAAGSLAPEQYAAITYHSQMPIYTRAHNQANDYSYGACTVSHVYWDKITVYRNGRLVAGTPPDGGGGEGGAGGEGGGGMGGI
ncbi:MAG TPA: cellulose binding domain-containing protein, partial [Polyangiaceae bacterium]